MTHLTVRYLDLKNRLAERAADQEGGLSIEWLALAAALVVILVAVGNTAGEPIANAVGNAFRRVAGDVGGGE
jgi:hypothetical protein